VEEIIIMRGKRPVVKLVALPLTDQELEDLEFE
jgi:antitoxin (DNA-binding transcriptional repressor) of toxin-antitoxin stability system